MLGRTTRTSHVKEFHCQYTDQISKKHKTWHDGRLKFFQLTKKFQLFTLDDNVLLASEFVSNLRHLECILSFSGFGKEEHRIFSQFLIIIECLDREYDRNVGGLSNNAIQPYNVKTYSQTAPDATPSNANARLRHPNLGSSKHQDSLALQFNRPFRRPRMAPKDITASCQNLDPKRDTPKINPQKTTVPKSSSDHKEGQKVSLALNMAKGASHIPPRTSRRQRLEHSIEPFLNDSDPSKPGASVALEPLSAAAIFKPKRDPTRSFRIHKKKLTIYHEPIDLTKF